MPDREAGIARDCEASRNDDGALDGARGGDVDGEADGDADGEAEGAPDAGPLTDGDAAMPGTTGCPGCFACIWLARPACDRNVFGQ